MIKSDLIPLSGLTVQQTEVMPPPCVFGCTHFERVHTFPDPNKYPDRFRVWVELAGLKAEPPEDITVFRKKRVCNNHFPESHRTRNNRLSAIAVPTLNLKRKVPEPIPDYNQACNNIPKDLKEERVKRLLNVYKDSVRKVTGSPYSGDLNLNLDDNGGYISIRNESSRSTSPVLKVQNCNKVYLKRKSISSERKPVLKVNVERLDRECKTPISERDEYIINPDEVNEVEKCIICCHAIVESHFVCIECGEINMCESCALRCEHNQHYMLRIPCPKPFSEVKAIVERVQLQIFNVDVNQSVKTDYTTESEFVTTSAQSTNTSSLPPEDEQFDDETLETNLLFEGDIPEPKEETIHQKDPIYLQEKDGSIEEHYTIVTDNKYTMQNSINYTIVGLEHLVESNDSQEQSASSSEELTDECVNKRSYDEDLGGHEVKALGKWKKEEHTQQNDTDLSEYLVPNR